jgi:hypothetical protein
MMPIVHKMTSIVPSAFELCFEPCLRIVPRFILRILAPDEPVMISMNVAPNEVAEENAGT